MKISRIKCTALTSLMIILLTGNIASAQTVSVSNLKEFKDAVISNMDSRNTEFTISYKGDAKEFLAKKNDYIRQAYTSDDYLRWSWTSIKPKVENKDGNVDVTFAVSYISTKEQEDYVDDETDKIISQVIAPEMTDMEKVRAIHDFVLKVTAYDYTMQSRSAYSALANGKTVCQGYAMLVYKLCEKAKIPARIITGTIPAGFHAWNEVQVDGVWYNIDTTYDDAEKDKYKFFCVSDEFMQKSGYVLCQ